MHRYESEADEIRYRPDFVTSKNNWKGFRLQIEFDLRPRLSSEDPKDNEKSTGVSQRAQSDAVEKPLNHSVPEVQLADGTPIAVESCWPPFRSSSTLIVVFGLRPFQMNVV
jgi:hypothetical protein